MAWRSVLISQPAWLKLKHRALVVEQEQGTAVVPLEDIAVIVIDHYQVTITGQLLATCASEQIAVITVDETHTPNGVLLAHTPHSRAVKVLRSQMAMTEAHKKRLWQLIVRQKIRNQAQLLQQVGQERTADRLFGLAKRVKSGDADNLEAQAAQVYFPAVFGEDFTRDRLLFVNSALNYGYMVMRSAIARSLVSYGFLPALGLHHDSELNAFNLADDLIEPYRILIDQAVYALSQNYAPEAELDVSAKASLVRLLHQDVLRLDNEQSAGVSAVLALIDATVISLGQSLQTGALSLVLPSLVSLGEDDE